MNLLHSYKDCFVTFVGSRKVTRQGLSLGLQAKEILVKNGCILRSGNALGFDQIVSMYVSKSQREIYLPYPKFGPCSSDLTDAVILDSFWSTYPKAKEMVWKFHPLRRKLPSSILSYLIRDVYQVLGKDLQNPSSLVVCWTPDGASNSQECTKTTGGTGMAIRIADAYGIPVMNLNQKKNTVFIH